MSPSKNDRRKQPGKKTQLQRETALKRLKERELKKKHTDVDDEVQAAARKLTDDLLTDDLITACDVDSPPRIRRLTQSTVDNHVFWQSDSEDEDTNPVESRREMKRWIQDKLYEALVKHPDVVLKFKDDAGWCRDTQTFLKSVLLKCDLNTVSNTNKTHVMKNLCKYIDQHEKRLQQKEECIVAQPFHMSGMAYLGMQKQGGTSSQIAISMWKSYEELMSTDFIDLNNEAKRDSELGEKIKSLVKSAMEGIHTQEDLPNFLMKLHPNLDALNKMLPHFLEPILIDSPANHCFLTASSSRPYQKSKHASTCGVQPSFSYTSTERSALSAVALAKVALPSGHILLALGHASGVIKINHIAVEENNREKVKEIKVTRHASKILHMQFNEDCTKLFTCATDKRIRINNARTGKILFSLPWKNPVQAMCFTLLHPTMLLVMGTETTSEAFCVSLTDEGKVKLFEMQNQSVSALAIDPLFGNVALFGDSRGCVQLLEMKQYSTFQTPVQISLSPVTCITTSHAHVYANTADHNLFVLQRRFYGRTLNELKILYRLPVPMALHNCFSNGYIVCGGGEKNIHILRIVEDGKYEHATLSGHSGPIISTCVNEENTIMVSADSTNKIIIWRRSHPSNSYAGPEEVEEVN